MSHDHLKRGDFDETRGPEPAGPERTHKPSAAKPASSPGIRPLIKSEPAPVQRRSLVSQIPKREVPDGPVEDWTNAVFRPDLYQQPVLPKSNQDGDRAGAAQAKAPLSAAPAPGPVVQKKDMKERDTGAATKPSEQVAVTVRWKGAFGADLSANVALYGRNGSKGEWNSLARKEIADEDGAQGGNDQRLSTTFDVPRYTYYKAVVTPTAANPDDRYKQTELASDKVAADAPEVTFGGLLEVERWNEKNVEDRFRDQRIDPAKAGKKNVRSHPLFGRSVQVNDVVADRVARTNALYEAKPAETKAEIKESLFVVGGYAYRTQTGKGGNFSNHSVGNAIDINYNEDKKQNALMEDENELALLDAIVEPVVQSDPAYQAFKIWKAKGQEQLEASRIFNERFPAFLADLLGKNAEEVALKGTAQFFDSITVADLQAAAKNEKDARRKQQLQLIAANWSSLRAWVLGAAVRDKHEKRDKTATGMIPLHEEVLQMMLDTGWDWGGDWGRVKGDKGGRKDYMHFEDRAALELLKLEEEKDEKAKK